MPTPEIGPGKLRNLVLVDEHHLLVLDEDAAAECASGFTLDDAARAAGPLLTALLKCAGSSGAKLYEMSPESQKLLQGAELNKVGSYFRGVLRDGDGRLSHQVQLREVKPPSKAPAGFDVAMAAQLAAVQLQLNRIEDAVYAVGVNVEHVLNFVQDQQRARIRACISLVGEIHGHVEATGALAPTDWARLHGVELDLETQRLAVAEELERRVGLKLSGNPKEAVKAMKSKVDAQRVEELLAQHRLLVFGLRQVLELTLLERLQAGHLDDRYVEAARARLEGLAGSHLGLLGGIEALVEKASKVRPRSNWDKFWSDGLVLGGSNDDKDLAEIKTRRTKLAAAVKSSRPPRALLGSAARELHSAVDDSAA